MYDFQHFLHRNDRDHKPGQGEGFNRDRNYNRGEKGDRNHQRNQNNRGAPAQQPRDDRDMKPRRPSNSDEIENRMPKLKPDVKPVRILNIYFVAITKP